MSISFVFGPLGETDQKGPRVRTSDGEEFVLDTPEGVKFLEDSEMIHRLMPHYPDGLMPLSEVDGETMKIILQLYSGSLTVDELSEDVFLFLHVWGALDYLGNHALRGQLLDPYVQKAKTMPLEELRSLFFTEKNSKRNFGAPKRSSAAFNIWTELCERGIDEWFNTLTSARFWELASMDEYTEKIFSDYCKDKVTWARVCPRQPPKHDDWEFFYRGLDTHGADPAAVTTLNLRGCIFPQRYGSSFGDWKDRGKNGLALLRTLKFPNLQRLLLGGVEGDHFLLRYFEAPIYPPYNKEEPYSSAIPRYVFDDSILFLPQTDVDQSEVDRRQYLDTRPDDEWDDDDARASYHAVRDGRMLDTSPYITGTLEVLDELNSPPLRCTTEFLNAFTTRNVIGFYELYTEPAQVDNTTHELAISWSMYLSNLPLEQKQGGFPQPINTLPPLPQLRWLYIEMPFEHQDAFVGVKRNRFLNWLIAFVQNHPTLERINLMDENAYASPNTMFLFVILKPENQGAVQDLPGIHGIHVDNTRRGVELWRQLLQVARKRLTLHYYLRSSEPITYCTEAWREGEDLPRHSSDSDS